MPRVGARFKRRRSLAASVRMDRLSSEEGFLCLGDFLDLLFTLIPHVALPTWISSAQMA